MRDCVGELEEQHQSDLDLKDRCIIGLKETTNQLSKENKKLSEKLRDQEEELNEYFKIVKDYVRDLKEKRQSALELKD
jgi:uncharacterized protein YoxC